MLPVSAVHAYSKPAPPPAASGHSKVRAHGHGRTSHNRPVSEGETHGRPDNDVKVDADDGGGSSDAAPQNAAPEHGTGRTYNATGSHGRPARPVRNRPTSSRPGTGPDSSFADADDPALPPEAAAAVKEADELQDSAGQANAPADNAPKQGSAPAGAAPAAPAQPGGATRPQGPVSDQSTNQTAGRQLGRARAPKSMPVAFFSGKPAAQGSRLVLHTTAGNTPERTVTLQCYPTGGTHPKAAQACADVARAGGDLAQMPANANPRACFMIYSPVTVTAQGQWHGQAVRYTKKFPNTCVMRDKTGSVFDF
ncbi:hypothetical protein Airi02_018800 [Actinoallomurus iriomotensis]|uniref:Subtilisin inhibitor domain-containing protein n=1 Tax=Actinoallomurus iriomotensis TaxID=478107 RepID=A0A9W6RWG1_9ACTN|nr:hypothetical protein Airi02_018800 [Actinoallomurus iriomotensis]